MRSLSDVFAAPGMSIGMSLTSPDPFLAEVLASAPLDFLVIDCEHAPNSASEVQVLLMATRPAPYPCLVRVPTLDAEVVGMCLDLGADGIVAPHIETAEQAALAAATVRYPPEGSRGFGPRRAGRIAASRDEYVRTANDHVSVVAMIESYEGVANVDEVVRVAGISGVLVGRMDLASSMGFLTEHDHPEVAEAVERVLRSCQVAGVPCGMYAPNGEVAAQLADIGATFVTIGSDLQFLEWGLEGALRRHDRGGFVAVPKEPGPHRTGGSA